MRKMLLVLLIVVMIVTPCFAQELEPEWIFSLHGTAWKVLAEYLIFPPPVIIGPIGDEEPDVGFYRGKLYKIYSSGEAYIYGASFYIDMIVSSFFIDYSFMYWSSISTHVGGGVPEYNFGIALPIGIGMWVKWAYQWYRHPLLPFIRIELLIKTEDNWIPQPPAEISISPKQGEQGTILTNAQITFLNTTVGHVHNMFFNLPDGVAISNWTVISDTQVECDINIAADAQIGFRNIEIFYNDDNGLYKHLLRYDAFEVIEKTN